MSYNWSSLTISNYKSIGTLHLDCAPINVFIGPPNSGKSNILEAMDIANLPYYISEYYDVISDKKFNCEKYFRVESVDQLFRNGIIDVPISISGLMGTEIKSFRIQSVKQEISKTPKFEWRNWFNDAVTLSRSFDSIDYNPGYRFLNESFRFSEDVGNETSNMIGEALAAPFGLNLGSVILNHQHLTDLLSDYGSESGFEFVVDKITNRISIQIRINNRLVLPLPFSALSETFRRMLFFTAAVNTSSATIITLDEPEALSFPPYISQLAKDIIKAASQKQFFISTHSPYLLNTFIEQTPKDKLAVFVCSYSKEERQIKARRLTQEELSEVLDYGVDLFFNLNPYLNDPTEHSM